MCLLFPVCLCAVDYGLLEKVTIRDKKFCFFFTSETSCTRLISARLVLIAYQVFDSAFFSHLPPWASDGGFLGVLSD